MSTSPQSTGPSQTTTNGFGRRRAMRRIAVATLLAGNLAIAVGLTPTGGAGGGTALAALSPIAINPQPLPPRGEINPQPLPPHGLPLPTINPQPLPPRD
jgi:hypothetical protein